MTKINPEDIQPVAEWKNENLRKAQEVADKVYEQLSKVGSEMLIAPQTAQMMLPAIQLAGVYAQLAQCLPAVIDLSDDPETQSAVKKALDDAAEASNTDGSKGEGHE